MSFLPSLWDQENLNWSYQWYACTIGKCVHIEIHIYIRMLWITLFVVHIKDILDIKSNKHKWLCSRQALKLRAWAAGLYVDRFLLTKAPPYKGGIYIGKEMVGEQSKSTRKRPQGPLWDNEMKFSKKSVTT